MIKCDEQKQLREEWVLFLLIGHHPGSQVRNLEGGTDAEARKA